jgi:hypothetical protein
MNMEKDESLTEKILGDCGHLTESNLKTIARTCAKITVSENFEKICCDRFQIPPESELEDLVVEEMKRVFDENVIEVIERDHPDWSEEKIDAELDRLEKLFATEHEEQKVAITQTTVKELQKRVKALQEELEILKRKYSN